MGSWMRCVEFICPFYTGDNRRKSDGRPQIFCEDGTRLVMPDREAARGYVDELCASERWPSCPIARRRNDFYERREAAKRKGKRK